MIRCAITRPSDYEFKGTLVKPGVYLVNNAYEGKYSFFKVRPLPTAKERSRRNVKGKE